ncbi:hypothetical protein HDU77_007842 [Chytriomyces hyalinus]|nr:hypothetical protein HDU77_007842 [Chytriomyces hyalinus]
MEMEMRIGFGTFRLRNHADAVRTVCAAIRTGYRLIDTAQVYQNEEAVGDAVQQAGVPRSSLFITTKVSPKVMTSQNAVYLSVLESLKKLKTDYIDLVLIHWPGTSKRDIKIPNTDNRLAAWHALEQLKQEGKVREIGVSNFTPAHLKEILQEGSVTPFLNQLEIHPLCIPWETMRFCTENGIRLQAYSSLGEGELVKTPENGGDARLGKVLDDIAERYSCSRAQLLLRWALQHNISLIPKSSSEVRMKENLDLGYFTIGNDDMEILDNLTETGGFAQKKYCWDPSTSDDDDDFMVEDDEEFDFEYEDEDNEEPDVDLENKYYSAKGLKEDTPLDAIKEFEALIAAEEEKGDWGFKANKQICKIAFKLGRYDLVLKQYPVLLAYIKSAVSRNYSEKSINNILDFMSTATDMKFLEEFYSLTLDCLNENKNDRLWVKTNLKLAKLWLDRKEFARLGKILRELRASCQTDEGEDDQKKGTLLLEIYALEIQMHTETKNNKKLKALYQQCLSVKSAIPHPRIMGVIRECGGKMHMSESEWEMAQTDFFEAFKNYDEAGSPQRIACLKYLVLANMLMESQINPFDSQETKPYKNDADIVAMTNLVNAYQRKDIFEFEKILRDNRRTIMDDTFIRTYINGVLKNIRTQVLIKLIKPYTRIEIPFISKQLNVPAQDVEDLLVGLILDCKISGQIDQVNSRLELFSKSVDSELYASLDKWSKNVDSLYKTAATKIM